MSRGIVLKTAAFIDSLDKKVGHRLMDDKVRLPDIGHNPIRTCSVEVLNDLWYEVLDKFCNLCGVGIVYDFYVDECTLIATESNLKIFKDKWRKVKIDDDIAKEMLVELKDTEIGIDTKVEKAIIARRWRIGKERVRDKSKELFPSLRNKTVAVDNLKLGGILGA